MGGYSAPFLRRWYGEYFLRKAQSSVSGLPNSPIHEAPASSFEYRYMSSSGT